MKSGESNVLTDAEYWSDYYQCHKVASPEQQAIVSAGSRFDDSWTEFRAAAGNPKSVCEIGCYPGRYLAYVASRFNLSAYGIDFNEDTSTIQAHMEEMGVENYSVENADFLSFSPKQRSEMVFSLGFVEHFENVDEVLDRHLDFLTERGALMVTVPNMRGLIRPYKELADRDNLKMHNLEAMRPKVFREFAERNSLKTHFIRYQGSFPWNLHHKPNPFQRALSGAARLVSRTCDPITRRFPSSLYSSELLALFSR